MYKPVVYKNKTAVFDLKTHGFRIRKRRFLLEKQRFLTRKTAVFEFIYHIYHLVRALQTTRRDTKNASASSSSN